MNNIILHAEYRETGYDEKDFEYLGDQLNDIIEFKQKAIWMPEAGGVSEIWMLIEFVGINAVAGIIGSIAWIASIKTFKAISNFVSKIRKKHKYADLDVFPEIMEIKVVFENLVIIFSLPNDNYLTQLEELTKSVILNMSNVPLKDNKIKHVSIPVYKNGYSWNYSIIWNREQISDRYWGIGLDNAEYVTHVYDSKTNKILENAQISFGKGRT